MKKISKDAAEYGPGMTGSRCGICRYFTAPDGCRRVEGAVAPKCWCRLFMRKAND